MSVIAYMLLTIPIAVLLAWYYDCYERKIQQRMEKEEQQGDAPQEEKKGTFLECWKAKEWREMFVGRTLNYVIINILVCFLAKYFLRENATITQVRWLLMLWVLLCVVHIDWKKRLIPNSLLLVMFLVRLSVLAVELITAGDQRTYLLLLVVIGAILGGGVMLIVYALSRGGLGFGDVKLYFILGFYVGSQRILELMMYSVIACALTGVILLVLKKAKLTDQLPFAPFAYVGSLLTCVLLNL